MLGGERETSSINKEIIKWTILWVKKMGELGISFSEYACVITE